MSTKHTPERDLTDLEALVVCYVRRRQPCTPYQVRSAVSLSVTSRFSSSSGSIYPLMRRLEERGILASTRGADARGARHYRATRHGLARVRGWITSLDDPGGVGVYDPIRSRLLNLSLLPLREQRGWLEAMERLLERQQDVIRHYETQHFVGDQRLYEISRQAMWDENATRLQWVRRALQLLTEEANAA